MGVNDNACFLNKRAALEFIASKLAPTRSIGIRLPGFAEGCGGLGDVPLPEEEEGGLKSRNDESSTRSRFLPAIAMRERAGLLMRLRAFRVCPAQSVLPGCADKFPRDVRRRLSER